MNTNILDNISYISVSIILIPFIFVYIYNRYMNIKISKRMTISIIRMFIQLSLVGLFLEYIFDLNNLYVNIAYLFIMINVATVSAIINTKMKFRLFYIPILISFIFTIFPILIYFNYFVAKVDNIFIAQIFIPVSGMLLGNSMSGTILAIDDFYNKIKSKEKEYFTMLSLSANRFETIKPYMKEAIVISVKQNIATMETIGLVALPGMMTGQILGGSKPMTAILYQIAIMLAIFLARYIVSIISLTLTMKVAFNSYDILEI